ncbi:MAG: hypothetical protein KatS3mg129_1222 [Leptospiraceae bacterium]|nr:MAG: hypothetical protein KatS3mg129_1222 [Leptospiraceae bacterium]
MMDIENTIKQLEYDFASIQRKLKDIKQSVLILFEYDSKRKSIKEIIDRYL